MSTYNLPASPDDGQTFTLEGNAYRFDSSKQRWEILDASPIGGGDDVAPLIARDPNAETIVGFSINGVDYNFEEGASIDYYDVSNEPYAARAIVIEGSSFYIRTTNTETAPYVTPSADDGTFWTPVGGSGGVQFTAADRTKLDGIATGADVTPSWVPADDPGYISVVNEDRIPTANSPHFINSGVAFDVIEGNFFGTNAVWELAPAINTNPADGQFNRFVDPNDPTNIRTRFSTVDEGGTNQRANLDLISAGQRLIFADATTNAVLFEATIPAGTSVAPGSVGGIIYEEIDADILGTTSGLVAETNYRVYFGPGVSEPFIDEELDATSRRAVQNRVVEAGKLSRPVANPTMDNSVVTIDQDGTVDYTTIPAGATVDPSITAGGTNAVAGGAIFTALAGKEDSVLSPARLNSNEITFRIDEDLFVEGTPIDISGLGAGARVQVNVSNSVHQVIFFGGTTVTDPAFLAALNAAIGTGTPGNNIALEISDGSGICLINTPFTSLMITDPDDPTQMIAAIGGLTTVAFDNHGAFVAPEVIAQRPLTNARIYPLVDEPSGVTIDTAISGTSTNAVENRAIFDALAEKQDRLTPARVNGGTFLGTWNLVPFVASPGNGVISHSNVFNDDFSINHNDREGENELAAILAITLGTTLSFIPVDPTVLAWSGTVDVNSRVGPRSNMSLNEGAFPAPGNVPVNQVFEIWVGGTFVQATERAENSGIIEYTADSHINFPPGTTVFAGSEATDIAQVYRGLLWQVPIINVDGTPRTENVTTPPAIGPDWISRTPIQLATTPIMNSGNPSVASIIGGTPADDNRASPRTMSAGSGTPGFIGQVVEADTGISYIYRPAAAGSLANPAWFYFDGTTLDPNDGLNESADGELSVDHREVLTRYNPRITSYPAGSLIYTFENSVTQYWHTVAGLGGTVAPLFTINEYSPTAQYDFGSFVQRLGIFYYRTGGAVIGEIPVAGPNTGWITVTQGASSAGWVEQTAGGGDADLANTVQRFIAGTTYNMGDFIFQPDGNTIWQRTGPTIVTMTGDTGPLNSDTASRNGWTQTVTGIDPTQGFGGQLPDGNAVNATSIAINNDTLFTTPVIRARERDNADIYVDQVINNVSIDSDVDASGDPRLFTGRVEADYFSIDTGVSGGGNDQQHIFRPSYFEVTSNSTPSAGVTLRLGRGVGPTLLADARSALQLATTTPNALSFTSLRQNDRNKRIRINANSTLEGLSRVNVDGFPAAAVTSTASGISINGAAGTNSVTYTGTLTETITSGVTRIGTVDVGGGIPTAAQAANILIVEAHDPATNTLTFAEPIPTAPASAWPDNAPLFIQAEPGVGFVFLPSTGEFVGSTEGFGSVTTTTVFLPGTVHISNYRQANAAGDGFTGDYVVQIIAQQSSDNFNIGIVARIRRVRDLRRTMLAGREFADNRPTTFPGSPPAQPTGTSFDAQGDIVLAASTPNTNLATWRDYFETLSMSTDPTTNLALFFSDNT